jgi:hypothetical protein
MSHTSLKPERKAAEALEVWDYGEAWIIPQSGDSGIHIESGLVCEEPENDLVERDETTGRWDSFSRKMVLLFWRE